MCPQLLDLNFICQSGASRKSGAAEWSGAVSGRCKKNDAAEPSAKREVAERKQSGWRWSVLTITCSANGNHSLLSLSVFSLSHTKFLDYNVILLLNNIEHNTHGRII